MAYLKYAEKIIDFKDLDLVRDLYNHGYIFGRVEPGYLYQTRSLRLNLEKFTPNSENRRILKKLHLELHTSPLPIPTESYNWRIHKLGKDFYQNKFSDAEFSAAKIKTLLTDGNYHFNLLFNYEKVGYVICYQQTSFIHYCYPFYDLVTNDSNNLGMYMMLQAILWAQLHGYHYLYLGGITRPTDRYKLQFQGLEYWENGQWETNIDQVKTLL